MENPLRLYSELMALYGQAGQWRDVRHLQTLAWMVVGLIQVECGKLTAWVHDLEGFTRNLSGQGMNQAGINASATCAHEYPPAKRR